MEPRTTENTARLQPFTVGDWLVEPRACRVSRGDTVVKLRPQLADLLSCLARRAGDIVLKEEILKEVWEGHYVAESGMSRCVAELRQVLQDEAQHPRYIETVTKRGYRLVAPVTWLTEEGRAPQAPPEPQTQPAGAASEDPGRLAGGEEPAVLTPPEAIPPDTGSEETRKARPPRKARPRLAALRRLWATFAVLALIAGIITTALLVRAPAKVLTERDTVLLADVSNTTGDPVFDEALRLALAVNLEQAPFLRILPQDAARAALVRAGRSADERVVGPIALEVCRREGAAVVLAGSIALLGSRYAVGVEAIECGNGESVANALTEAASKEDVLEALEQAASRIRQRLGESRESLQLYDVPLVQATTPSLEALRALSIGDARRDRGRFDEALAHYRSAVDIDPEFALAWARRGVMARNVGLRDEAVPALRRAFELRGRVSQPERFFIEGTYHSLVTGDPDRAIETYQAWKRTYPGSPTPPNNIAATLSDQMGQYEDAIAEAREAIRLAPYLSMPYSNLVQALVGAGRFGEAKQAVEEASSRDLDDGSMHAYMLILALLEDDGQAVEREVSWAARDPQAAMLATWIRASVAASRGRLAEARRFWLETLDSAVEIGRPRLVAQVGLDRAEAEALIGDPLAALALAGEALSRDKQPMTLASAAIVFALAGDPGRSRAALEEAKNQSASDPAPLRVWLAVGESLLANRLGRAQDAIAVLQPIGRFERGNDFGLVPLGVRGMVALSAGRPADAAAAFDELLRLRAVSPGAWDAFARVGLARALRDAGNTAGSLAAYDAFLESWRDADPGARLLKAARTERAALAGR